MTPSGTEDPGDTKEASRLRQPLQRHHFWDGKRQILLKYSLLVTAALLGYAVPHIRAAAWASRCGRAQ